MDLRNQQIKDTFGNLVNIGTVAGTPTTGTLQNGAGSNVTTLTIAGTLDATNVDATNLTGTLTGNVVATNLTGTLQTAAQTNITSVGTLTGLTVSGNANFDSGTLFVDASSNAVGIGTSSPSEKVEVTGNIKLSDGTFRDIIGPTNQSLRILANPNSSDEGIFFSTDGGTTTEMFIQDGGNVGIGTDSPGAKLDVRGSSVFNEDGGNNALRVEGLSDTHLIFADAGNDRVGIGTSSPTAGYKLSVNGGIRATGDSRVGSLLVFSNSGSSIANGAYIDVSTNTGGGSFLGFVIAQATSSFGALTRTQTTFSMLGRGTDTVFAQISTDNGPSGGASFTLTTPSNGVVRMTNTSGNNVDLVITVLWISAG